MMASEKKDIQLSGKKYVQVASFMLLTSLS
jgi:hypothetical protein